MVTIKIDGLRKTYGGIVAVEAMDLDVASGTIHAIVGENGAGKSTLMKALAGAIRPDAGSISIDGQAVELASARAARDNGIGIVYQELSILPDRPLLANLFVNREPTRFGLVATREMERLARPVLARLGLDVDLDVPVGLRIDRRATADRARQGAVGASQGAGPRRAELGAQRPRDPATVRHPARVGGRGDHGAVRVTSPRGGLPDRRSSDGDARRPGDPDPRHHRPDDPRGGRGDGRDETGGSLSGANGQRRRRRGVARCRAVERRHRLDRRELRGPPRRDRRVRRDRRIRHRTAARNAVRRAPGVEPGRSAIPTAGHCRRVPRRPPGDGSAWSPPTAARRI